MFSFQRSVLGTDSANQGSTKMSCLVVPVPDHVCPLWMIVCS